MRAPCKIAHRVFRVLLDQRPMPERFIGAFQLQRARFEMISERKLRRRQRQYGRVEINGRGLSEMRRWSARGAYS